METVILNVSSPSSFQGIKESAYRKGFRTSELEIDRVLSVASESGKSKLLQDWIKKLTEKQLIHSISKPDFQTRLKPSADTASDTTEARLEAHASPRPYTTAKYASIYNFPTLTPATAAIPTCIGVISFGGGFNATAISQPDASDNTFYYLVESDVQAHWRSVNITSMPTVAVKYLPGATVNDVLDTGSTAENTIDVEMIGSCYPSAALTIIVYIARNSLNGFQTALNAASTNMTINGVSMKPSVLSISWGAAEVYFPVPLLTQINATFQRLAISGVNVCVATGDFGSSNGVQTTAALPYCCDFPSSSPYVVACGGTSLICPSLVYAAAGTVETAWTGGGGAISRYFAQPLYQYALGNIARRSTPDIALNADPNTGVAFTIGGSTATYGGTSIVAPAFAAYLALLRTNYFILPQLYSPANRLGFHDIKSGSNGFFKATVGYDHTTGLGSINGTSLSSALPSTAVAVSSLSLAAGIPLLSILPATNTKSIVFSLPALQVTPSTATNKAIGFSISPSPSTVYSIDRVTGTVTINNSASLAVGKVNAFVLDSALLPVPIGFVFTLSKTTLTASASSVSLSRRTTSTIRSAVSGDSVLWYSTSPNVCTVSATGLVTGKAKGNSTIWMLAFVARTATISVKSVVISVAA